MFYENCFLTFCFDSHYFREHGLKMQVAYLPGNGVIGSIYICSLRQNDNGVLNLSVLNVYLTVLLEPLYWRGQQPVYPAVYGDAIFTSLYQANSV
jgi:hypothetical protein